ncbi:MAG: MFS transporter [Candidatus Bathyarchaeia archaeon]
MSFIRRTRDIVTSYLVFDKSFRPLLSLSILTNSSGSLWTPLLGLYLTNNLAVPVIMLGLITTVQQLVSSLAVLPSGLLSDTYGRRRMMIMSMVFSILAIATILMAKELPWLFLISIFQGLSTAFMDPSRSAYVIDIIPHEKRGMAYATLSFLQSLSGIVAQFAATLIVAVLGFQWLFVVAAALELVSLIGATFFLRESLNRDSTHGRIRTRVTLGQIKENVNMLKNPPLLAVLFGVIFHQLGLGIQNPYLSVYANQILLFLPASVSLMLSLERLGIFIGHFPSGRIVDVYGEEIAFAFHIFVTSPLMIMYMFSTNLAFAGLILFAWGLTFGLDSVSRQKLIAKYRQESGTAAAFGTISLVSGMVSLVSPTIGGWIWTTTSPQTVFYASAAVNVIGSLPLFALWLHGRRKKART